MPDICTTQTLQAKILDTPPPLPDRTRAAETPAGLWDGLEWAVVEARRQRRRRDALAPVVTG